MFGRHPPRREAVAAIADSFGRDIDHCLDRVEWTVRAARARGARLVVFPEATLGGYLGAATPPQALPRDGDHVSRLAAIAGETVICLGYTEAGGGGGELYSSAMCVSGDGLLGHHRKVHIPPTERGVFAAGEGIEAFDTPIGRLGMLLCYDKMFPEAARALSLDGAEIIASMAAWAASPSGPRRTSRDPEVRHFNLLDQTRALENQVVWVSANLCGRFGKLRFPGQAKVVDPEGRVLARTHARSGMALARVDTLASVSTARTAISHLGDRQPEAYTVRPGAIAPVL